MNFEEVKKFMNSKGWIYDPLHLEFRKKFGSKVIILENVILEVEDEKGEGFLEKYVYKVEHNREELMV